MLPLAARCIQPSDSFRGRMGRRVLQTWEMVIHSKSSSQDISYLLIRLGHMVWLWASSSRTMPDRRCVLARSSTVWWSADDDTAHKHFYVIFLLRISKLWNIRTYLSSPTPPSDLGESKRKSEHRQTPGPLLLFAFKAYAVFASTVLLTHPSN
jgi:hypothetical protein